jgi:coenzyme F420-0:L-glutamate ligase/coenzyme F420-1:gamma-L-glutamate ligase
VSSAQLTLTALPGIPNVSPGDDLADLIGAALDQAGLSLRDGDILVVAQKIVSKAEGRQADLNQVKASARARKLAEQVEKDPRLVELILSEAVAVVGQRPGVLVVEHRNGYVLANAGIDASNVAPEAGAELVLLLPEDPDRSAADLRTALRQRREVEVAVIINDSLGRAWRSGTVGAAIGAAGLVALQDLRGQPDLYGNPLRVSLVGLADELAAAASVLMGQGDEGLPVVLVRGLTGHEGSGRARDLVRDRDEDLFR